MAEFDKDEQFYRDTESIAFPKLDDRQLAMLEPLGTRRLLRGGEMLFKAGQRDLGLTVILRGELEVFESRDGQEQILGTPGPRDFVGDVAMLMGTAALASARGKADESEILEVPAAAVRQALAELPGVSEPIVRAFIMRRQRLRRDREFAGLRIVAQDGSRDGNQIDDFLDKNHIPHRLIKSQSPYGQTLCERFHLAGRDLPALITANGMPLRHPSLREVARVAGLLRDPAREDESEVKCDLVIVGAGPAGLAAAVYAGSEGLKTIVLESYAPGGQAAMFLAETAQKVLLVIRGADLSASMSSYLSRRVETRSNIEILTHTQIIRMTGTKVLQAVELENVQTHERRTVETPAVFSMIGAKPCTAWLPPEIDCDEKGFIKTGHAVAGTPAWKTMSRLPGPLETSQPGIFAVGDVRSGSVKRCAAAVGEGGMAVAGVHEALGG